MPSPFNNPKQTSDAVKSTGAVVETVLVTNSVLVCDVCFQETDTGVYVPQASRLTFTCPAGHENVVRNIEL